MTEAADQRFAPPQAHVEDIATGQMELAGRGTRLGAAIVDGLIAAAVIWVVYMLPFMKPVAEAQAKVAMGGMWHLNLWALLIGAVVFVAIQGWPLLTRGQTIAKMIFKLRIVRPDGSKPDAFRLLGLRYGVGMLMGMNTAVSMVWALVDCLLIFRESRKCLHDTIADTVVIKL